MFLLTQAKLIFHHVSLNKGEAFNLIISLNISLYCQAFMIS